MSEPLCRHETITTWGTSANRLWACTSCSRRFYPACETCVDVGHRNETHPLAAPAEGLDVERLARGLVEAVLPLEVIAAQDRAKPYAEVSRDFIETINDAIATARSALAAIKETER